MNRKSAALIAFPKMSIPIALVLAATVVNVAKAQSAAPPAPPATRTVAQNNPPRKIAAVSVASSKPPVVATPQSNVLTVGNILSMAQAGLSDDLILARLRKENQSMDLSTEDLISLKRANVSDRVIRVMMDPNAAISAPPAPIPAAPPAIVAASAPIVAGLPVMNPSGATPNAGSMAPADTNDPLTPHDSGIYLYTKDRDGKPQMTVLERAAYQGSKTGGIFASAMTYGIKKIKSRAVIPGSRASIRVAEQAPVFYFYFDDKAAGLGKSYFGVNNLSNPNQFALLKLEVTKSNRETVIGQVGAFSASSGTDAKALVTFKSERLRAGLYKVVVDGLQPGEYCFLASSGSLGAYGAGAAGAVDIFDFGYAN